jgi:hypothetical protein
LPSGKRMAVLIALPSFTPASQTAYPEKDRRRD